MLIFCIGRLKSRSNRHKKYTDAINDLRFNCFPKMVYSSTIQTGVIFLATGLFKTIGLQWLGYAGAAKSETLIPSLIIYLGTLATRLFTKILKNTRTPPLFSIFFMSLFEVVGHFLTMKGLFIVGSGLYQVVYSSLVVFTAIIGRLWLKKKCLP